MGFYTAGIAEVDLVVALLLAVKTSSLRLDEFMQALDIGMLVLKGADVQDLRRAALTSQACERRQARAGNDLRHKPDHHI